jgi:hypothetical protein
MFDVELSILAAPGDVAFLQRMVEHQVRAFADSTTVRSRVLVLDDRPSPSPDSTQRLQQLAEGLLTSGVVDEVRSVEWSADVVASAMKRWFGDVEAPRQTGRRAIYQYVYSFESARLPLVLHLDSDVLFHGRMGMWLDDVQQVFSTDPSAIAVVPNAAIPQATRPSEWLFGRRVHRSRWEPGWSVGTSATSRGLLVHRDRLIGSALPLRRGSLDEQWEASLESTLKARDLRAYSLLGCDTWMLHPHRHNAAHAHWLDCLIAEVEAGSFPYRRFGHPWDITTEGWKFMPWLPRLALRWLRRVATGAVSAGPAR